MVKAQDFFVGNMCMKLITETHPMLGFTMTFYLLETPVFTLKLGNPLIHDL
jgi:hypothetical protein